MMHPPHPHRDLRPWAQLRYTCSQVGQMDDFFEMQFSCGSGLYFYLKTMRFGKGINAISFGIELTEQLSIV